MEDIGREVFDEDVRCFLAVYPKIDDSSVHGGEKDAPLNADGNLLS